MDILPEIIAVSNEMIDTLDEAEFFEGNPFIERLPLKRKLQIAMQRKWEQEGDMYLTDAECEIVMQEVLSDSVGDTIESLVDKGALNMNIDTDGTILYKVNKDFNFDQLDEL
jgi:hypothetical protein